MEVTRELIVLWSQLSASFVREVDGGVKGVDFVGIGVVDGRVEGIGFVEVDRIAYSWPRIWSCTFSIDAVDDADDADEVDANNWVDDEDIEEARDREVDREVL